MRAFLVLIAAGAVIAYVSASLVKASATSSTMRHDMGRLVAGTGHKDLVRLSGQELTRLDRIGQSCSCFDTAFVARDGSTVALPNGRLAKPLTVSDADAIETSFIAQLGHHELQLRLAGQGAGAPVAMVVTIAYTGYAPFIGTIDSQETSLLKLPNLPSGLRHTAILRVAPGPDLQVENIKITKIDVPGINAAWSTLSADECKVEITPQKEGLINGEMSLAINLLDANGVHSETVWPIVVIGNVPARLVAEPPFVLLRNAATERRVTVTPVAATDAVRFVGAEFEGVPEHLSHRLFCRVSDTARPTGIEIHVGLEGTLDQPTMFIGTLVLRCQVNDIMVYRRLPLRVAP